MRRRELLILSALAATAWASGAGASEKKAEKKKGGGASYLQIQPLTATTIRTDGRRGVMTVELGLDVPNAQLRDFADKSTPRLRAAYVQVVQIYASGLTPETPLNPDFLGRELQRETDRVLGKTGARLLLGTILVN